MHLAATPYDVRLIKPQKGCKSTRNAQISGNFQGTGGPVISVGGLCYSALSPELPTLEHSSLTLLPPSLCQENLGAHWKRGISEAKASK